MNVALYARASAASPERTVEQILGELAAHAERKGWSVALECADPGPALVGRRPGLDRLAAAVRAKAVEAVLVQSLGQVARNLRHMTELGLLLASRGVALVALAEEIDTTGLAGDLRWRDWLAISAGLSRQLRSEAARVARRNHGKPWGHPVAVVNPRELQALWEGQGRRRPLSQREIAAKLGVSTPTVRRRLRELRAAGTLDGAARSQALAAAGGLRRGPRANPLDDTALATAWADDPCIYAVARRLRVRRSRVEARLRELGLRKEKDGRDRR